jgi:O-antigen ligase
MELHAPAPSEKPEWSALNIVFAGFLFFAVAYPMPSQSAYGFISPMLAGFLIPFMLVNALTGRTIFYTNRYVNYMLIALYFLLLSDIACVFLFKPGQQALYVGARLVMMIIFLAGLSFKPDLRNLYRIVAVYSFSIFLLSLLTIAEGMGLYHMGNESGPRTLMGFTLPFSKAVGFDMSDGEFGLMVGPAFLFALLQFHPKCGLKRTRFRHLMLATSGLALIISQSRSTYLGLVVAIGVAILLLPKGKYRRLLIFFTVVGGLLGLVFNLHMMIIEGMTGAGRLQENVVSRFVGYVLAWKYFLSSPIIGIGHGNALVPEEGLEMVVHNQLLDQLASAGLSGILPAVAQYATFFWIAFKMFLKAPNPELTAWAVWMLAAMSDVFVELMLYRGFYTEHVPWYFAMLGLIYSVQYGYKTVKL